MPTKAKAIAEPIEEAACEVPALDEQDESRDDEDSTEEAEEDDSTDESEGGDSVAPERLTGQALLDFYAEKKAAGQTHAQIAWAAGYYTVTKTKQERVMQAQFNEAMLEAQGIETGGKPAAGRAHAGLTKARVSGQGILLVSQLATRHVGAQPGTVFSVEYPAPGLILLTMTDEFKPVVARKASTEEAGTSLLDGAEPA